MIAALLALLACAPPALTCPAGEQPEGDRCVPERCAPPADAGPDDVWVLAGAGGDGSEASPFGTITEAIDAVAAGRGPRVLVGPGDYDGAYLLNGDHDDLELIGRCPGEVRLTTDGDDPVFSVELDREGQGVRLSGLDIRGAFLGVQVYTGTATLSGLEFHETRGVAVHCDRADSRVSLLQSAFFAGTSEANRPAAAIYAERGCELSAEDLRIEDAQGSAIYADDASVRLTRVDVDGVTESQTGHANAVVALGGDLTAEDLSITRYEGYGLGLAGGSATIRGLRVAEALDTGPPSKMGVYLREGAAVHLEEVEVAGVIGPGLQVQDSGLTLLDASIRGARSGVGTYGQGRGILSINADVSAERLLVESCEVTGISVTGGSFALRDGLVRGTRAVDGDDGRGIALSGASFTGAALELEDNAETALLADASALSLSGVRIQALPTGNPAIILQNGSTLSAENLRVSGGDTLGIAVEGSRATLREVVVEGVRGGPAPEQPFSTGRGLNLRDSQVLAESLTLRGNGEAGLAVFRGEVVLHRLRSEGNGAVGALFVETRAQGEDWQISDNRYGGVFVNNAWLQGQRWSLRGNSSTGIGVVRGGWLSLEDCEISEVPRQTFDPGAIGAYAEDPGSQLSLSACEIAAVDGPGLWANLSGAISCAACSIHDVSFAGAGVWDDGTLSLSEGTWIGPVSPHPNEGGGVGVYATDFTDPATLLLDGVRIDPQPLAGLYAEGAVRLRVAHSALRGGTPEGAGRPSGNAVLLIHPGEEEAIFADNLFSGSGGEAVLLHGGAATFAGNTWQDNAIDLWWQGCDRYTPPGPPGGEVSLNAEICPAYDRSVSALSFHINTDQGIEIEP